jgi:hypothetical protein
MRLRVSYFIFVFAAFLMVGTHACRKTPVQSTGGEVQFLDDTLSFDTVFTAAGSFTAYTVIYNPQNEAVILSSVRMLNSTSSYFHLNVDGFQGNNITNLKIAPHDSIYVFATVNVDPNDKRTPFVITDSLVATLNGKDFYLPFMAYGQNAHYIVDSALSVNAVWDTTLPYVIIHTNNQNAPPGLQINPGVTLTLNPGCRIYMHQTASITVFGTLIANGTKDDSVIFQGDRLDRRYFGFEGYPGEWGSIYFGPYSTGNRLSYARIENAGNGALGSFAAALLVNTDSVGFNSPSAPKQLTLDHCVIKNCIAYGLLSYQGTVAASNCLFATTGAYAYAVLKGGYDSLVNCTFANYGGTGLSHSAAGTVAILNYYSPDGKQFFYGDLNATMRNCIVYGTLDSEIVCSAAPNASANLRMYNCLLKMGNVRESFVQFHDCIFNRDPLFANPTKGDFHLKTGSPAIDKGMDISGIGKDLDNMPWGVPLDMGCYQYKP